MDTAEALMNDVTVVDDQAGTVLTVPSLAPGASAAYSGSYAPTGNGCGPFTDTATASGADLCTRVRVSNQASATCTVVTAPAISVTKVCDGAPFVIGQPIRFRGMIRSPASSTFFPYTAVVRSAGTVLTVPSLTPGATADYSGSFAPTGNGCGPFTDTVTATGADQCTRAR